MKKSARNLLIAGVSVAGLFATGRLVIEKLKSGEIFRGNDEAYALKNVSFQGESVLTGKKIIFLGSSLTYGSASMGESFVDFMEKRDGIIPYKEALSGTTLVDEDAEGKKSYIARMMTIDKNFLADAFVCQLSTNDATLLKPLGEISTHTERIYFDTHTVAGAIEYIISYIKDTWKDCPVIFYITTQYKNAQYERMIDLLYEIKEKWGIGILDLWNDPEMNAVSKKDFKLYMAFGSHPTRAGYLKWWTPKFEAYLKGLFG